MLFLSSAQTGCDAGLNRMVNSDTIVHHPPTTSDLLGTLSDQVQVEMDLAHETVEVTTSEERNEGMREWTISWEEASERELEYQRRMKQILQQCSSDSQVLSTQSLELPPRVNPIGLKRKAASESVQQPAPQVFPDRLLLQQQLKDRPSPPHRSGNQQLSSQRLQDQQPLLQQLQYRQPSPQQLRYGQTSLQQLKYRQPSQRLQHQRPSPKKLQYRKPCSQQSQYRRPFPQQFLNRQGQSKLETSCWCHLCKVDCTNIGNLKFHHQGKKHKAKIKELQESKNAGGNTEVIWCTECNIPCMNEMALAWHRVRKKHLACSAMQAFEAAAGADAIHKAKKIDCEKEAGEAHHVGNLGATKMNVATFSDLPMRPMIQSPRLRTTNWPNCL